jgi:hypothetical protein
MEIRRVIAIVRHLRRQDAAKRAAHDVDAGAHAQSFGRKAEILDLADCRIELPSPPSCGGGARGMARDMVLDDPLSSKAIRSIATQSAAS